jgi:molybdopterin synthase catalytic subunit
LQEQIRSHEGTPATRRRMFSAVRHRFDALMPRGDDAWIRVLASHEQSLLRSFERVIDRVGASDPEMKAELHRQLPRLHSIDLDMHSLAKAIGVGH